MGSQEARASQEMLTALSMTVPSHAPSAVFKDIDYEQAWWLMPAIPAPGRMRQKDPDFRATQGYISSSRPPRVSVRLCHRNQYQLL